jgi:predicted O-linked N-acetylglucosamine transferase (SPINDLY family)
MTTTSKPSQQALLQAFSHSLRSNDQARTAELASELARAGALPITDLFNLTQQWTEQGRPGQSVALFRLWLQHTDAPAAYAVHFNLAVTLSNMQDQAGAEAAYRRALELNPDFIEGHLNLGTLLERQGDTRGALLLWNRVTAIASPAVPANQPFYLQALNNLGRLLEILKQYPEAEDMLTRSLLADPAQPKVITHLIHLRQKQCKWPIYAEIPGVTAQAMHANTSALAVLSASGDPQVQLDAARRFVAENVIAPTAPLAPADGYRHDRLRIGYLSSDLQSHAVSILTAELYELHDRSRTEVFAFSWSRDDGTPLRARVVRAMDHYIPIAHLSDEQAARCIRDHEIDILIDLHGLTSGTRPNILSWRPAPVQVTYLGFPGPTALPCIDYVLADRFVLPPDLAAYFVERPLYLPDTFQINDRQRAIGPRPTRAACALPEDAFVYCSFNNNFKITETIFACWMRILQRTPGSVLWLVADHDVVRENLRASARLAGVDPERLYFAARVSPADYLARYQVADLFLDTDTFNAGTTGSDALWAGLPLLTCAGQTFSSRMAGSLLLAAGLPELVTHTLADYEELAVQLFRQPPLLATFKQRLADNRLNCPLFDSPRLVRNLEDQLERIAMHPAQEIKQTPINDVHNADVYNFMRKDYGGVVEVGSSSGALARVYREANPGCSYVGIEIDAGYADASRRHCTEVILGNVEKLSDDTVNRIGKDAQCWVFADALEHLYDPWQMLRRIKQASGAGTEVVACIPNAQYWGLQAHLNGGKFIYQDSGIFDRTHIRWLTRLTIIDLFQANGFRVENMIARILTRPSDTMEQALRQMALASGNDPDLAVQDATAFQYVVKAVAVA